MTLHAIEHLPPAGRASILRPLLDHLAAGIGSTGEQPADHTWQGWRITRIGGGANNLLYHITGGAAGHGGAGDLAVKFTMRDGRDRAGHEHGALRALEEAGLDLAPRALLLDRERYRQPVVVQTWLPGESSDRVPETEGEWLALIEHLVQVHAVTPARVSVRLDPPTLDARTATQALDNVHAQVARLPPEAQPDSLRHVLRRMEAAELPAWPAAPLGLCRCDNNLRNYVRIPVRPHGAGVQRVGRSGL
jgi:hypothetical protein